MPKLKTEFLSLAVWSSVRNSLGQRIRTFGSHHAFQTLQPTVWSSSAGLCLTHRFESDFAAQITKQKQKQMFQPKCLDPQTKPTKPRHFISRAQTTPATQWSRHGAMSSAPRQSILAPSSLRIARTPPATFAICCWLVYVEELGFRGMQLSVRVRGHHAPKHKLAFGVGGTWMFDNTGGCPAVLHMGLITVHSPGTTSGLQPKYDQDLPGVTSTD